MGHTKGEWILNGSCRVNEKDKIFYRQNVGTKTKGVAIVSGVGSDECEANARLIAAAPDLLRACKYLCIDIKQRLTKKEIDQRIKYVIRIIDQAERG